MMDSRQIQELIPHRHPFLFVDEVTELDTENVSAVGWKHVSADEPFLEGHFPGRPIMPGVLIVEALAQLSLICLYAAKRAEPGTEFFLTGVEDMKFRRPVIPGDSLKLCAKFLKNRKSLWKVGGSAFVEEELVAEGTFSAYVPPATSKS